MSPHAFRGLTWDHPRGYRALEAAAERAPSVLRWERQPLEGFESHPIDDLARRFDLLVLDHPHLGDALAGNCLQPIETWFSDQQIEALRRMTVGHALDSYRWEGRTYALPLDVAAQVMARDPAVLAEPPDSWDAVVRLSESLPVALSIGGPHALLTFFSLCLSFGTEPGGADLVDEDTGRQALMIMRRLAARVPSGSADLNPIALLEALSRADGIALVPLVFGYVNYATGAPGRNRVAFSEAPCAEDGGRRGSVLGGTGIGITGGARPSPALTAHLKWLLSKDAQCRFIPDHDGQPSARAAWHDEAINAASGDFYEATVETVERAWVRPRFAGYVAFQTEASALLREACFSSDPAPTVLERLRQLWRDARRRAGTSLLTEHGSNP